MTKVVPKYNSVYVNLLREMYSVEEPAPQTIQLPENYRFGVTTISSQNKNPNQKLKKIDADAEAETVSR